MSNADITGIQVTVDPPGVQSTESINLKMNIRNNDDEPFRILDLRSRLDLQEAYCKIQIESEPTESPPLISISDPGPVLDDDFIYIQPHDALTISISSVRHQFKVGSYTAFVIVQTDPYNRYSTVSSPAFDFTVE